MARALLIVDFQNDFTSGGALAVPDGDAIAPRLNELIDSNGFDLVVATRDLATRRPPRSPTRAVPGRHCVQGSHGAELNAALNQGGRRRVVDAGYRRDLEGYSGFEETELAELLRERGIDEVTVVGLATDYCVKETAADALRQSFQVAVDRDGIRGIDVEPGDSERALELRAAGAEVS